MVQESDALPYEFPDALTSRLSREGGELGRADSLLSSAPLCSRRKNFSHGSWELRETCPDRGADGWRQHG